MFLGCSCQSYKQHVKISVTSLALSQTAPSIKGLYPLVLRLLLSPSRLALLQTGLTIWKHSCYKRYQNLVYPFVFEHWKNDSSLFLQIRKLSKVDHKNFLNVIGYCHENEPFHRMLVFEYAPNGSLSEHLHCKYSHLSNNSFNFNTIQFAKLFFHGSSTYGELGLAYQTQNRHGDSLLSRPHAQSQPTHLAHQS